ncbi:MAG: molybdate ABC transporter substrate-binding protein [Flavobacteriales bacterium]|nr:molybdate ABC transporter substrate-binding protein [Flavobacteriales bacterium]
MSKQLIRKFHHFVLLAVFLTTIASCMEKGNTGIRVAVAANMQYCMRELLDSFHAQTQIAAELVSGSSGNLLNQILHGAPYHVFVSADTHYANQLQRSGRAIGEPVPYARGRLILWSVVQNTDPVLLLEDPEKLRHVAIANPGIAPYGEAARRYLENRGIWNLVQDKIVFGEHVAQVNQFIRTGAVDVGITAASAVADDIGTYSLNWRFADTTFYEPILQAAIGVQQSSGERESMALLQYLRSASAQNILHKHGYLNP